MGVGIKIGGTSYKAPSGSATLTSTTTWTVPRGIRKINIYLVGAGGKGGTGYVSSSEGYKYSSGGGGASGGYITRVLNIEVRKGDTLSAIVGSGNTTVTMYGTTYTANKGNDGSQGYVSWKGGGRGANGITGGGGGSNYHAGDSFGGSANRAPGGVNGGNGEGGYMTSGRMTNGGTGDGTDCYINGVRFSDAGSGGGANTYAQPAPVSSPNTGQGGGGAPGTAYGVAGADGGTGTVIITW